MSIFVKLSSGKLIENKKRLGKRNNEECSCRETERKYIGNH